MQRRREAEEEETRRWYQGARKAVIRCLFGKQGLGAASVLEPDGRTFEDFTSSKDLAARLEQVEVILGIDPHGDLERMGIAPGERRLVDLSPPRKTVSLNRRGRTLRVTPELVLSSTLGLSRALGDPRKMVRDLMAGSAGKVFRRLQADLKALWRLYQYGCLHGEVRLEWGFLRECLGVGWNIGRLPCLYEVIEEAVKTGDLLEAVLGRTAPGWEDPWSRGIRLRALKYDWKACYREFVAEYAETGERESIPFGEVAAIRPCPGDALPALPAPPSRARPEPGEIAWPDERDDRVS